MKQPNTVAATLMKARDYLSDESRWCKNALRQGDARCAVGAVLEFCGPEDRVQPAVVALNDANGGRIVALNNDANTTHADILEAMDRAIAAAMEE